MCGIASSSPPSGSLHLLSLFLEAPASGQLILLAEEGWLTLPSEPVIAAPDSANRSHSSSGSVTDSLRDLQQVT